MKPAPQHRRPPALYQVSHRVLGPLLRALGLSCRDACELCSAQMDRRLTVGESFRLRFHLVMCGICRQLPRQFRGLRELVRACEDDHARDKFLETQLSPEVKQRIVAHLRKDPKP